MGDGRSSESDYERCRLNQTIQHSGETRRAQSWADACDMRKEIHDMRRLLEAIKCNHNPLEGSPRWLSNQPGSKGDLSADGPLLSPWTRPQATCSFHREDAKKKPPGCSFSSGFPSLSSLWWWWQRGHMCVSHIWICPSVSFFFARFVLVCMCVHWQILVPAGLHLVFCPIPRVALWEDKYLKSRGTLWPEVWQALHQLYLFFFFLP